MAIHAGDLFDVLPTMEAESFDACVTDPPYDLTANKKGGSGVASVNLDSPYGRARVGTGNGSGGFMGMKWDGEGVAFRVETWQAVRRVLKPGAYLLAFGGTRTYHRMATAIEDAGFEIRDSMAWLYGSGFPKNHDLGDGKGTALKPAFEPIVVAWKPFKGTISACHQQHGTAALNIDAARIPTDDDLDGGRVSGGSDGWDRPWKHDPDHVARVKERHASHVETANRLGRWPANVVMDEEAAAALDEQTGELVSGANPTRRGSDKFRDTYGTFKGQEECDAARGLDIGGASRFYYVAKPSREERDAGCHDLSPRQRDDSRREGNPGGDNPRNRGLQPRGNFHPTVKPVELMRYLVKLVTPLGGRVIDPFGGSGTTAMACAYEQREFDIIEREAEYVDLIRRRVASVAPLFTETA